MIKWMCVRFSIDYKAFDTSTIINIHIDNIRNRKKHDIKCLKLFFKCLQIINWHC